VRFPRALPVAVFLFVSAVTLLSSAAIQRIERQSDLARLDERARSIASALERRANANASYLRAGAALFQTNEEVPASQFRRFVSELRLDADFRGAEGIGWAQRVDRGQVDEFNRLVMEEYGPGVKLNQAIAPDQPFAVPVTYLEPDTRSNRQALGFDMYSEAVRREAMVEAERTARPTASGKVMLFQDQPGRNVGFLMYMPVFDYGSDEVRLDGFVYSVFNAQDFLASALEIDGAGYRGIRLFDRQADEAHLLASVEPLGGSGPRAREEVMITDHPWVLEVTGLDQPILSPFAGATLLAGFAVAFLLAALIRILNRQATEDRQRLAWYEEQNAIRDSLARELNHRVKNTLANVLSIVALTRRRAHSLDDFAESLDGRIRALSATHDLLTQSDWGATPVRSVIEAELAPYARDAGTRIEIEGPEVELAPKDALSLGLAIHELATNAAKYGALSRPGGTLEVSWSDVEDDRVGIAWVESGGPPVATERKRGFGMDLIERIVAQELQSKVEMEFATEGVRCTMHVPVRAPSVFDLRAPPPELS